MCAGTSPTRPRDSATEALVSPATAYRYFPNMRALMLEVATREAQPKIDDLLAVLPEDPEERIDALVTVVTGFQFDNELARGAQRDPGALAGLGRRVRAGAGPDPGQSSAGVGGVCARSAGRLHAA